MNAEKLATYLDNVRIKSTPLFPEPFNAWMKLRFENPQLHSRFLHFISIPVAEYYQRAESDAGLESFRSR